MPRVAPIFAAEKTAAAMLDMSARDFRALVEAGALPPPRRIGRHERWSTDELRRIIDGTAIDPDEFET